MEDIWFAVKNPKNYYFNVDAVMMKRRVLAPYKIDGIPKDWTEEDDGNFRLTHPSNFGMIFQFHFGQCPKIPTTQLRKVKNFMQN